MRVETVCCCIADDIQFHNGTVSFVKDSSKVCTGGWGAFPNPLPRSDDSVKGQIGAERREVCVVQSTGRCMYSKA